MVILPLSLFFRRGESRLPCLLCLLDAFADLFDGGTWRGRSGERLGSPDMLCGFCVHFGDFFLCHEPLLFQTDLSPALVAVPEDEEKDWSTTCQC